jgi:diaminopimelate epimerase
MRALKGHGTENDFVLLPDLDGAIALTPALVRALCDRHAGIGGDGVLRVVRSKNDPESKQFAAEAEFFMDYRNADGSCAEMCGNGVRVFMRYLTAAGLADQEAAVATRGGIVSVRTRADGDISVQMGSVLVRVEGPLVTAAPIHGRRAGAVVRLPNPHVVVRVSAAELDALDLAGAPIVDPPLPDGQNVEFVVVESARRLRMRVHERGVGETRSCGTGICAAVAAMATADGSARSGETWRVDVPGGVCRVVWHLDGAWLATVGR